MKECIGCGVSLQFDEKDKIGYSPKLDNEYCQRCFKLMHYNETPDIFLKDEEFEKIIRPIARENAMIILMVDIFDFDGSLLKEINELLGDKDIYLVGNKSDLLPKAVKKEKIINWMKKRANELDIIVQDAYLVSSTSNKNIEEVVNKIYKHKDNRDVYVVGITNTGKSTFINAIINLFSKESKKKLITTSYFPGTTLGMIHIPMDEDTALIDTPGIINKDQMVHLLTADSIKKIMPKKEVKQRVYQLNPEQSLFFGGLSRFDFVSGAKTSFSCYFSNDLNIHRTKTTKAVELMDKIGEEFLSPPSMDELENLGNFKEVEFNIKEKKTDIVISGLGWITINTMEEPVKVIMHIPESVNVHLRKSCF